MSDVSQGPGWWIASDGKWYAPHLHPDYPAHSQAEAQAASAHNTALRKRRSWPESGRSSGRQYRLSVAAVALVILVVVAVVAVGSASHSPKHRAAAKTARTTPGLPSPWSSVTVPAVTTSSSLQGVSCPSTTFCVAVGSSSTAKNAHTNALVEVWNGDRWSTIPTPSSPHRQLDSISCTSTTSCVAVGNYYPTPTHSVPFSEVWDGSQWTVEAGIERTEPNIRASGVFTGVSCASASFCIAVGNANTPTGTGTLAEQWNGANWSLLQTPNSPAEKNNWLTSVSCVSSSFCMAVGYDGNAVYSKKAPISMTWNGSAWSLAPVTSPGKVSVLYNVSCTSPTVCEASGGTFAVRWTGTSWTMQSAPASTGSIGTLSCSSGTCQAVASYYAKTFKTPSGLLAEGWDGSSWNGEKIAASGKRLPALFGISCASPSMCIAVGDYTKTAPKSEQFYTLGPYAPLAEEFSR